MLQQQAVEEAVSASGAPQKAEVDGVTQEPAKAERQRFRPNENLSEHRQSIGREAISDPALAAGALL